MPMRTNFIADFASTYKKISLIICAALSSREECPSFATGYPSAREYEIDDSLNQPACDIA